MNGFDAGQPSGGTPVPEQEAAQQTLRNLIDRALVLSRAPGTLEPTAAGGIAPSRALGDFMTAGLQGLYDATGLGTTLQEWLSVVLDVDDNQLAEAGPVSLARLMDEAAIDPTIQFGVPAMTIEEDRQDARDAAEASEQFGQIPDDLPKEPGP